MAKVALNRCETYDLNRVRATLTSCIEQLGGWERYIQPGETVLLKVNLLMRRAPEHATTTHPVFVEALATLLVDQGADVIIGDSPGGPFNRMTLKAVYNGSGYAGLHRPDDHIVLNENVNETTVHREDLKLLKQLQVIEVLNQVDKVISVSKLKTHGMTVFTGAVKNMFGTIPGIHKAEYHFKMPKIEDFSDMLVDVCINADPVLSFMDGIVGMEGAGPSSGDPIAVGAVLASDSPYHLDRVATELVGIAPEQVPTIARCIERGLIRSDGEDIMMTGMTLDAFGRREIEHPDVGGVNFVGRWLPEAVKRPVMNLMNPKPVFDPQRCIRCGDCVSACPPDALTMKETVPEVDLSLCIRCFCCQELCPQQAVSIHRNPFLKWLVRL